jgi:predicted metal-dependent HD superfamily phosphohydrolase
MSNLARWSEVWEELGLKADPELHADLRLRYSSSARHYHTLHHLMECLELFAETRQLAEQPAEVELALWFHDAIYEVKRHDNEIRSAEWAQRALRKAGADDALVARIYELVMVTRHEGQPATPDQQLLSDIDLAILGARPSRFDEYERQVREEYKHVPSPTFKAVRRQLLQGFLARPRIYHTQWFYERRERLARGNLERSLRQLSRWRLSPM